MVEKALERQLGAQDAPSIPCDLDYSFLSWGGRVCFSIHKMGKRLDEITANFPFGFDIRYSRIHQMDQSELRDSGGVTPGPFIMTSALSPSLIPPRGCSSCSIRC